MTKKIIKCLSFLVPNLIMSVILGNMMSFDRQQWMITIVFLLIATASGIWVARFWEAGQQTELQVMQNRMLATIQGQEPRGVLTEPNSPYYDLIHQFNTLQNYIKQTQQTAQRDVTNYQSLLASLPVGVINVNRRHVIDVFNATAADLLGIQQPKIPIAESLVIKQFTLSELITQTFNTQHNQQSILNLQINGEVKQYEVSTLYHQGDLKHAEVMIIIYDLTSVLQVERMQSDFLANASHELKTPLTAITGFVETLQGPAGEDPNTRQQFLKIVADESDRLSSLVIDILSLSRVKQKNDAVDTKLTIKILVDEQWQHIKTMAATKHITLKNNVSQNFVVHGLKTDLETILQNLIINAVKYNKQGGDVSVTVYKDHQHWQINVKDSGIGIPKNQQSRIFERFYRGDESRQRTIASGTGLGLAIVNELVSKHNGEVKVNSQVGVGTTISVTLPL
ncbi:MAG: ATP-binding protein [Leuconostoc gelidum]|jgi:two-component system, OmpR family, phosphate regulon sensor histidine kinase PhoR|uniref:histidine kinase n=1 Tax=Leuconostoc gelidum subsp. gelidum TaxID=1607839 RepID=A0AB35FYK6_LEUGE|nr:MULTISPECIES: ATP-binding protein [Leuconostoc]MBR2276326.1 histidine kinase [Leuconostoc sp.]MBZ5964422.1 histidine kinase [Leuconostoc gelidum subsp. gelidum]MBZ5969580.1 histidine kinase [Leuconostoc gasicomitatum]MBZ5974979.1 histidine kinase [Leuconostoc gelidum subsp. gelidum]MBZ5977057.1 histidine kinase [Leuconostoc gelidum subsp. gelidum]